MPDAWANDAARRAKAGVPETVTFKTKPQIALDQIKWACEAGLPKGVALIDAGYGGEAKFRTGISALDLRYVAGIKSTTNVWAPGTDASCRRRASGTMPPPVYRGRGRRALRPVRDDAHKPVGVEQLALSLPKSSWRKITWREGSNALMSGRFARVRVRSAHDRDAATQTIPEEWLLIEWPDEEKRRRNSGFRRSMKP